VGDVDTVEAELVPNEHDIELESSLFLDHSRGESIDCIAIRRGIPYAECAAAIRRAVARRDAEVDLIPAVEDARLQHMQAVLQPAVDMGDVVAIKEARQIGESRRALYGVDKKAEVKSGSTFNIAFVFGSPESRLRLAPAVGRPEENDLRPSPDPLDRDGNEDGQDGSGVSLDRRGDREG
jgi:hypothetical protein